MMMSGTRSTPLTATATVTKTPLRLLSILTMGSMLLVAQVQADDPVQTTAHDRATDLVASEIAPPRPGTALAPVDPVGAPDVRPQGPVVWDNGPYITNLGIGANGADVSELQTNLGGNTMGYGMQREFNNRVADDFIITGTTQLSTITFYAYQNNSTELSTITRVDYRIWNGPPGDTGSTVLFNVRVAPILSNVWSNVYRVTDLDPTRTTRPIMAVTVEAEGIELEPATYWLDWQMSGALPSGPWQVPVTRPGRPGDGNGRQFYEGRWIPALDAGVGWQDDFPFLVAGQGEVGFSLFIDGFCPGEITLTALGATDGGRVLFVYGTDPNGTRAMPPGQPCEGVEFGLGDATKIKNVPVVNGRAVLTGNVQPGSCGRIYVQALDLETCTLSEVLLID